MQCRRIEKRGEAAAASEERAWYDDVRDDHWTLLLALAQLNNPPSPLIMTVMSITAGE
jgi:hypothetical protein